MKSYESDEQAALFEWARSMESQHPDLIFLHHIPNGGKREKAEAARLKQQGVKPGVSDVFLPVPKGKYHGFYIEMKVESNKLTDDSLIGLKDMKRLGYATAVCYSWIEAKKIIENYLELS